MHTMHNRPDDAPVIQLVDTIVKKAIMSGASDIHFESHQKQLRVRFRVDGILYDQEPISLALMPQVLSRIKILANLDIAEKRIPQDGKFATTHNKQPIDLRISSFPAMYGEKIVVRILDRNKNTLELASLGFQPDMLTPIMALMQRSNGFFLVTGPTGSGKTTTLYAALAALNSPEKNIITLEDPVEYGIMGITQGQVNPEAGFTFEKGIRAILRQDPDIVMIGEIRDRQTAQIAIEAALTGHVVLSTLHTNDAPSVIMRLMDMGVEPFLLNAAINGILAQRLARKICTQCRIAYTPTHEEQEALKRFGAALPALYRGNGCSACFNLGYKGRTGIFELLQVTSSLRSLIVQQPNFDAIHTQALADGMKTLFSDGLQKVKDGIITLEEFTRVLA